MHGDTRHHPCTYMKPGQWSISWVKYNGFVYKNNQTVGPFCVLNELLLKAIDLSMNPHRVDNKKWILARP